MANSLKGERKVTLNGVDYTLRLTMNVIAEFQDMRECDFMHCAFKSLNAVEKSRGLPELERAVILTEAVSLDDAVTLFWLAAKESNSQVEFGEIQEAFIDDIDLQSGMFYPALFADLCSFALAGGDVKKKKTGSNG